MDVTKSSEHRAERIAALGYDYSAQPAAGVDSCNLCGHASFVVLTHHDRYGYPAQAFACATCGLVFLNPRMTAQAYGRFYDGIYRPLVSAYHGRLIDARTIQDEQRAYAVERAGFIRPFVAGASLKTMLDIGGSTGVVADHFARELGLRGTVIDPAPLEVEQARRFGLETITGLVEEHDFGGQRFDLVVMCQTVDHLLDVRGTLARIRQLLTDRGLFFMDIADFRAAYLREWSVEGAVKIDHPYYLIEPTMTSYLLRAGFEIARMEYESDHLHIGYICRPAEPRDECLPDPASVRDQLREIRFVQNTKPPARLQA